MVTDAILLVGGCKRDGGDNGTSLRVRFRPNVDSSCGETILMGFARSFKGATVGEGGRFLEVRGCGRHARCCKR